MVAHDHLDWIACYPAVVVCVFGKILRSLRDLRRDEGVRFTQVKAKAEADRLFVLCSGHLRCQPQHRDQYSGNHSIEDSHVEPPVAYRFLIDGHFAGLGI